MSARRYAWFALGLVLAAALVAGTRTPSHRPSEAQRVHRIAAQLRCPECRDLSAADSDAAAARAVRAEIARRVHAGQSDAEIRAFMVSVYGSDILLTPPSSGLGALAWALPVIAVLAAAIGLAAAFARWESRLKARPSDSDRALVEQARHPA